MPKEYTISLKSLLGLEPPVMKEVRKMPCYYLLSTLTFGLSEAQHKETSTDLDVKGIAT